MVDSKKLPKRISPCPIVEAIVEIRFTSEVLPDAIFGIIYQDFRNEFPGPVEKLPILQLPEAIRSNDPNLIYQPYYKLSSGDLILQVGPRVASLSNVRNYMGWEIFSQKIKEAFLKFEKLKIIRNVERSGVRYINFFKLDIFDNINLQVILNGSPLKALQTTLKAEIGDGKFINRLQIVNNAQASIENEIIKGSVIDIDTFSEGISGSFFGEMEFLLEEGHNIEKKLFFVLLKPEFLNTLNPEY